MSYVPLAKEELVEVPTSSRWLAVSSELCFRYDSVYARPRRRDPQDRPRRDRDRDRPLRRLPRDHWRRPRECDRDCDAHSSTATATASLYFLSAWYCSALPPRWILLQICLWPRRQWSCWHVESQ